MYTHRCKTCGLVEREQTETILVCNLCGKQATEGRDEWAKYLDVPPGWFTLKEEEATDAAPFILPRHYCSTPCLVQGVE